MKAVAIAAAFASSIPVAAQAPPKCPTTAAITPVTHLAKLPAPVRTVLQTRIKDIVDSTEPFDATDAVQHGARFNRFAFAWSHDNRSIIVTEHGGFAYNNPVYVIEWKPADTSAQITDQKTAFRGDLCAIVNDLYQK